MKKILLRGIAAILGSAIGLGTGVYCEEARKPVKAEPIPFEIIETEEPGEPIKAVVLTAGEKTMLQKMAIVEAGSTDADAMALVMLTVLNRAKNEDGYFPKDVEGVLFQKVEGYHQFPCVAQGGAYWSAQPNEASAEAIRMIENGFDESNGALFFNREGLNSWASRNREYLFSAYGHDFYG